MADNAENARLLILGEPDELRAHLDALNESGVDYRASGMDAHGGPFLATLHGPYADTEHVLTVSPWDGEVDFTEPDWCEECAAHAPRSLDDLTYPVIVIVPTWHVCGLPEGHHPEIDHALSGGYSPPLCGQPLFPPGRPQVGDES